MNATGAIPYGADKPASTLLEPRPVLTPGRRAVSGPFPWSRAYVSVAAIVNSSDPRVLLRRPHSVALLNFVCGRHSSSIRFVTARVV